MSVDVILGTTQESISLTNPTVEDRKRKRTDQTEDIVVDVAAPEPISKKALRKAKKVKSGTSQADLNGQESQESKTATSEQPAKSAFGVWIGNLAWTLSKDDVREFFQKHADLPLERILRVHMPQPVKQGASTSSGQKFKNKGFAYVDFDSDEARAKALASSETLLSGRKVLIKEAADFAGRPEKSVQAETKEDVKSKSSRRVFVGNLDFETTTEDLTELFSKCGEVLDIHMATFEDSGKCKGFAWLTFAKLEDAEKAQRGWFKEQVLKSVDGEDEASGRSSKQWTNRLRGRQLRLEFAEDSSIRYQKRYAKRNTDASDSIHINAKATDAQVESSQYPARNEAQQDSNISRLTGAIMDGKGKKTVFAE